MSDFLQQEEAKPAVLAIQHPVPGTWVRRPVPWSLHQAGSSDLCVDGQQERPALLNHHLLGADELTRCMIPVLHVPSWASPPPRSLGAPSSPKCQGVWLWDVTTRSRRMVVHRQPPLLSVGDLLEEDESPHSTARSVTCAAGASRERMQQKWWRRPGLLRHVQLHCASHHSPATKPNSS